MKNNSKKEKMKPLKLLPHYFKNIGWIIFIPSLILGIASLTDLFQFADIPIPVFYNSGFLSNENKGFFLDAHVSVLQNLAGIFIIIGGTLVGFSKEKIEDEYISNLRLKSVFWSLIVSYAIVLLLFLTVFGTLFFTLMIFIMFLPLVLYVFRFNFLLLKK